MPIGILPFKMKHYAALIFLFLTFSLWAQEFPGILYGGSADDAGISLLNTSDGGYLITGTTKSFGSGSQNMFILKLNHHGYKVWSRVFGWQHQSYLMSVIPNKNGYAFAGYVWDHGHSRTDIYLLKTDLAGNRQGEYFFGTNNTEMGFNLKRTQNGDFLLLGYSRGKCDPYGDIYVVRATQTGDMVWDTCFGTNMDDYAFDLTGNDDNGYFLIGNVGGFYDDVHANFKNHDADICLIKIDKNGRQQWIRTYGESGHDLGYAIVKVAGSLYLLGSSQSYGHGSFDMLLIRTDLNGAPKWMQTYGGPDYEYGRSMSVSVDKALYLFGTTKSLGTNDSPDFYLVKTNYQGEEIWSLTIGGASEDYGYKVVATADSGCVVLGKTKSFGEGGYDMLFVKVNKNGMIENILNEVDSMKTPSFTVAPNPAKQYFHIVYNDKGKQTYRVKLYSTSGVEVASYLLENSYQPLDIRLPAGLYLYRITNTQNQTEIYTGKLVVQ